MSNHLFLAYESCKDRFDKPISYNYFFFVDICAINSCIYCRDDSEAINDT